MISFLQGPLGAWFFLLIMFYSESDTFAVLMMKYSFSIVAISEISLNFLLILLGALKLSKKRPKKAVKRIQFMVSLELSSKYYEINSHPHDVCELEIPQLDIAAGVHISHLLVFIPLTGYMVTRYRAHVLTDMELAANPAKTYAYNPQLWILTQRRVSLHLTVRCPSRIP